MVPLVALLASPSLDVFTVARETTSGAQVLWAFDVPGPYRVVSTRRIVEKGAARDLIRVSSSNGRTYEIVIVAATGRCQSVTWAQGPVYATSNPPSPMAQVPPAREAAAERGLGRLGLLPDLLPHPWGVVGQFRDFLVYLVGYGGHPLFAPVNSRIVVRFDHDSGDFAGFYHQVKSPEPDRTQPRLSQAQAIAVARLYLATHEVRYYPSAGRQVEFRVGSDLPELMPYAGSGPTLGWILPRGASRVRLAWSVPYWDRAMETPEGREAAGYVQDKSPNLLARLYIDAATGKRVESDDVPMERSP